MVKLVDHVAFHRVVNPSLSALLQFKCFLCMVIHVNDNTFLLASSWIWKAFHYVFPHIFTTSKVWRNIIYLKYVEPCFLDVYIKHFDAFTLKYVTLAAVAV